VWNVDLERIAASRCALAGVHDLVVIVDALGTILEIDNTVESLLGYPHEDVIGRSAFDFLHPGDHQLAAVELLREVDDAKARVPSVLLRLVHADGSPLDMEAHGFSFLDHPEIAGVVVALRIVTRRPIGDRAIAAGTYLFSSMATVATDATIILDQGLNRIYSSPSFARMLNRSSEEAGTRSLESLLHGEDLPMWTRAMSDVMDLEHATARVESRFLSGDERWMWLEATFVNLFEDSGVQGLVIHFRDVDERRRLELKFRHLAQRDFLTGLANRFALIEELRARTDEALKDSALLFVDLDEFKQINDLHGHSEGDDVLVWVAAQLLAAVRPGDIVSRLGGDEFCVLCADIPDASEATAIAERLDRAFQDPTPKGRRVRASIGFAVATEHDRSGLDLLTRADQAMYEHKRSRSGKSAS
jgi:diguanylate cyclase (GGDEF)-like protein/PAS domain S-box-containing protein